MTLQYFTGYVQRPSTAPTINSAGAGTYTLAHRRISSSGRSQVSAFALNLDFPITLTPEPYLDDYLGDEILASDDLGATWRLLSTGTTGQVVLPSFDPGSPLVSVGDSQAPGLGNLDFGLFSATESPVVTFYAHNLGPSNVENLILSVFDTASLQAATEFSGKVAFAKSGGLTFGSGDGNLLVTTNDSTVWSLDGISDNGLEFTLIPGEVAKLELQLVNFPANGNLPPASTLGFSIDTNENLRPLPVGSPWPVGSILIDETRGLNVDFLEGIPTGITVKSIMVNFFGLALVRRFSENFVIPDGDYRLIVQSDGKVATQPTTMGLALGGLELLTFTLSSGVVSNVERKAAVMPSVSATGISAGAIELGDWVSYNVNAELQTGSGVFRGVSLGTVASAEPLKYATRGKALVKTSGVIVKGDLVGPDAAGLTVAGGTEGVALEDESNGFCLIEIF